MQIRKIFEWDGLMGRGKADAGANNVYGRMIGLRQCKQGTLQLFSFEVSSSRIIQHNSYPKHKKYKVHPL
jgi:hypothetical protein